MKSASTQNKKLGKFPQLIQTPEGKVIAVSSEGTLMNSFSSMDEAKAWQTQYQALKQFSSTAGTKVNTGDAMKIFMEKMKQTRKI